MDELLADFYKEKSKIVEKESKRAKAPKKKTFHEEQDAKAASLSELVDVCQIQADNSYHLNVLVLFNGCVFYLMTDNINYFCADERNKR